MPRLEAEQRLRFGAWWLDDDYTYNTVPFNPSAMSAQELQQHCVDARRQYYTWSSILRRSFDRVNRDSFFMWRNFFLINTLLRAEVSQRDGYPLGDLNWQGQLIKAQ